MLLFKAAMLEYIEPSNTKSIRCCMILPPETTIIFQGNNDGGTCVIVQSKYSEVF